MTTILKPKNAEQVLEAVAWAAAGETPLEIVGAGSKRTIGRPVNASHTLDMSALAEVTLYEADELVLSAGPGALLVEIQAILAAQHQELAFEPPDYGLLLGGAAGAGTLGGLVSSNFAGPRRLKAGAARDHFLGFEAVSGRGEMFKSGGRVVKNVTGYDLSKVMAGAWGTLGVLTSVTLKVLPMAAKTRTVLVFGCDAEAGVAAMTHAMRSPYEVSAAAWAPQNLTALSSVGYVRDAKASVTAIRVEGPGPSVEYRCQMLREQLGKYGACEELHGHNSGAFWREIRDVSPFAQPGDERIIWKISVPPQNGAPVATALCKTLNAEAYLDWAGGLIWLAVPAQGVVDGGHEVVRVAIATCGGHATIIRAGADIRARIPVFQPQAPGLMALSKRLKDSFDPLGVLNAGRMTAGI
ncbi:MAG: glycolate oxidase FAD binding subunit [Alphaproteobacteria bacterium]|jgi:glycolate oxidase FAD binding subunit